MHRIEKGENSECKSQQPLQIRLLLIYFFQSTLSKYSWHILLLNNVEILPSHITISNKALLIEQSFFDYVRALLYPTWKAFSCYSTHKNIKKIDFIAAHTVLSSIYSHRFYHFTLLKNNVLKNNINNFKILLDEFIICVVLENPTVSNSKLKLLYDDRSAILVTPKKPHSFVCVYSHPFAQIYLISIT